MSERKHAGGRPALPKEDKRHNWNISLNATEQAAIERAAARAGQPARVWVRDLAVAAAQAADS